MAAHSDISSSNMKSTASTHLPIAPKLLFSFLLIFSIFTQGCGVKAEASASVGNESELIKKIDAVHKQMMKQGNVSEAEREAILALASLVSGDDSRTKSEEVTGVLEFEEADKTPVYPGCEGLSASETKTCFMQQVNQLVEKEFDKGIAKDLGISEGQTVEAIFKITETGEVMKLKVRDANVRIQAEVARVMRLLPRFEPAVLNGEQVAVMCAVVVPYGG